MNPDDIRRIVEDAIGNSSDATKWHGILRHALVTPVHINVIESWFRSDKTSGTVIDAWLVFVEQPESMNGYRVVANVDGLRAERRRTGSIRTRSFDPRYKWRAR
jgi:hypothetical protein